ncbi:MAG: flavin reductase [Butyricicoccus sp.]|jgi:flavin reductase (DIM6/NTAB) family NADH-FMN oxidoreductase RutF/rubredoxin|nr:flavin reductase [Clostridiales bacterium]
MIDRKAFDSISYSIAIVGSCKDGKFSGCAVNSLQQLTSSRPAKFAVTLNKYNVTAGAVEQTGAFSATVAAADCPTDIINLFGYKSGRVVDKFAAYEVQTDAAGCPYITDGMAVRMGFRVLQQVDLGSHIMFIAEVTEAEVLQSGGVLTVEAFRNAGKDVAPNAPIYRTLDENYGYRCTVCGYIHKSEELRDSYKCPICKAPASKFEKL